MATLFTLDQSTYATSAVYTTDNSKDWTFEFDLIDFDKSISHPWIMQLGMSQCLHEIAFGFEPDNWLLDVRGIVYRIPFVDSDISDLCEYTLTNVKFHYDCVEFKLFINDVDKNIGYGNFAGDFSFFGTAGLSYAGMMQNVKYLDNVWPANEGMGYLWNNQKFGGEPWTLSPGVSWVGNVYGYCQRSDIEFIYGYSNVKKWADLENEEKEEEIHERVTYAIQEATNDVDNSLRRGGYTVPFETTPSKIKQVTAELAGVWLYESRGVTDYAGVTGDVAHQLQRFSDKAKKALRRIAAGQMRLEVEPVHSRAMQAVDLNEYIATDCDKYRKYNY